MSNLPSSYILNLRSRKDGHLARSIAPDAKAVRIGVDAAASLEVNKGWKLWIDPNLDGCEHLFKRGWSSEGAFPWEAWIKGIPGHEMLVSEDSLSSCGQKEMDDFVARMLDEILKLTPAMISVPQISPTPNSKKRNEINRRLAKATGRWKVGRWSRGQLILPIVLTDHKPLRLKADYGPIVNAVARCSELSHASGVWVASHDYDDLAGVASLDREGFPALIRFHEVLRESTNNQPLYAGPYWAINLILWARGIAEAPVIGCGHAYKYFHPSIITAKKSVSRVAIPPLRRAYVAKPELRTWLRNAIEKFDSQSPVRKSLQELDDDFGHLMPNVEASMRQVARFYMKWIREIAAVQPRGRSLLLFQDFSDAVVNGAHIGAKLPAASSLSAKARDPGFAAEQFMLQCLPR